MACNSIIKEPGNNVQMIPSDYNPFLALKQPLCNHVILKWKEM